MAFLASSLVRDVGLRLLLSPISATVISRTACVAVGVGFPVYSTIKAIESQDQQDQEQWLMYWTVYGCFHAVEIFGDKLFFWFPYYHHFKLAFLIWLQLPISNGSRKCFIRIVRPFFLTHKKQIDSFVDEAWNEINQTVNDRQQELELVRSAGQKLVTALTDSSSEQEGAVSQPEFVEYLDNILADGDTINNEERDQS
ncbi:hypothetical protein KP509_03G101600 [Ceratopteris richardii]|uniref:HVA22-like protein n=1 Tax=Ceratopteris richardii TaxID=49495 RepID=A0A8T2V9W6_CERRI|nr:hypothetical protein KP509_03G101600 [Ceratopteris richardii]